MSTTNNEGVFGSIRRQSEFWEKKNHGGPLMGLRDKWVFPMDSFKLSMQDGELNPFSFDPSYHADTYIDFCEKNGFLQDEIFLPAVPMTAFPWLEAICGCKVYYSKESNVIWSEHYLNDLNDLAKLKDYRNSPWFEGLLKYLQILKEKINGRYPMAITLMRGPGDIASALRGAQNLIYDIEDEPDKVMKLLEICTEIYIETWKAQIAIIPEFYSGYCCGQLNLWAPGKTMYLQEDVSAILSPKLYREFILPFDTQIAAVTPDYSAMHIHSVSTHVLEDILSIKELKCLQIGIDIEGPTATDLINKFRLVQESGKCLLVWGDLSEYEVNLLKEKLEPEGLCIFILRGFGQT